MKKVPIICLGGGTYHKPPIINRRGFVIHESSACVNYLKEIGKIDSKYIYKEWASYDTIGNVYFSLVNHIKLMGIKNIMIITSDFHMPRVKLLFRWLYFFDDEYNLYFHQSSDKGLEYLVDERIEREMESILNIKNNLMTNIKNLHEFHKWFYTEHNAYSSADKNIEIESDYKIINENILKTY